MRIAVVGATGRIGAKLTRTLLDSGHEVRALSRGGAALDALVDRGAEPFVGSFDAGTGDLDRFFDGADAAFLMVKTDWGNIHGHYSEVALRFFDALRHSSVARAVSLSAMGSEIRGSTGHFQPFYQLDQILNRLTGIDLVHLQASWFMENLFAFTDAIARYGRIAWSLKPDVRAPWVATDDIAAVAAQELVAPTVGHRVTRELGIDYTMPEIAGIVGAAIGRPISYRYVDRLRRDLEAAFLDRFGGTLEKWLDETQTMDAINDGRVRFGDRRVPLPTTMPVFAETVFKPHFDAALSEDRNEAESFTTWSAGPALADANDDGRSE